MIGNPMDGMNAAQRAEFLREADQLAEQGFPTCMALDCCDCRYRRRCGTAVDPYGEGDDE